MTSVAIKRELWDKLSLAHIVDPDLTIWDIELDEETNLFRIQERLSNRISFAWVKGTKLTVMMSSAPIPVQWDELLDELGVIVDVLDDKLMKRIARAFSPRDIVIHMPSVNICIVADNEFTVIPDEDLAEDEDRILDGMVSINPAFARRLAKLAGIPWRKVLAAEGLSLTILTPDGILKAFGYLHEGEWTYGDDVDIVSPAANMKKQLKMAEGRGCYVMADLFSHYGAPKTNAQMDVMMGRHLYMVDGSNMVCALEDVLAIDERRIVNGEAARHLDQWNLGSLRNAVASSNKVNADFANLGDMVTDFEARGISYVTSPTQVSMLATSASNKWWSISKEWPYYPLPCAKSVPLITESGAAMIGNIINVEPHKVAMIREGTIAVVRDEDWLDYIMFNGGGMDLDDHVTLVYRTDAKGNKVVLVLRNPMGPWEFSYLGFTEGDPFPTFERADGSIVEFPRLSTPLRKTISQRVRDNESTFGGLPDNIEVDMGDSYGPDLVFSMVSDIVQSVAGFVGTVINAVVLAFGTKPELVANMPCTMEKIVDLFTTTSNPEVREALTVWAQALVQEIDATCDKVDAALWAARAGGVQPKHARLNRDGFFVKWVATNHAIRQAFLHRVRTFNQNNARIDSELISAMQDLFGMTRAQVKSSTNPWIRKIWTMEKEYRYAQFELNRDLADIGGLKSNHWSALYQQHADRIMALAGGDEELAQLLTVLNWFVAMSMETYARPGKRGNLTDKSDMNSRVWPLFIQGLVKLGLAADIGDIILNKELDEVLESEIPTPVEASKRNAWEVTCSVCGTAHPVDMARTYLRAVLNGRICKSCRS